MFVSRQLCYFPNGILSFPCVLSHCSRPTLCDPMDYSPPGSSVHGILQARILERVAVSFSRGSSRPRDWSFAFCASCIGRAESLPLSYPGSPIFFFFPHPVFFFKKKRYLFIYFWLFWVFIAACRLSLVAASDPSKFYHLLLSYRL